MRRKNTVYALTSHYTFLIVFFIIFLFTSGFPQTIGQVLPQWTMGTLDIHHINTGKGDATLFIFPDGTTMLVDAGATSRQKPRVTSQRPDDSRTPGEWIARYIKHMLPKKNSLKLNYALLTHFHGDHMGDITKESRLSSNGRYKLSGITEVAEYIHIQKLLDRGWPHYNWPAPLENEMVENYSKFLKWQIEDNGMKVERFQPGHNDQIVLLNEPDKYPGFEVRNIASNGEIWTGVGTNTRKHFPQLEHLSPQDQPNENMCCNVFRLSYGNFDYFTGGDIPGIPNEGAPQWHDIETPVAKAVGPVEVNVLNHHGYVDSENAFFLSTLRPRVHILLTWAPSHPGQRVLSRLLSNRLYPGPRDIFATNMMEANKIVIGSRLNKLKSDQGHIVVRVTPGGQEYWVIILDDSAETFKIMAIHGPYKSK